MKKNQGSTGGKDSGEALEQALQELESQHSFPKGELGKVAEAWTYEQPLVGETHTLDSTGFSKNGQSGASGAFAAGMDIQLAQHMTAEGNFGAAQEAMNRARQNLQYQRPAPPTQLVINGIPDVLPGSLRSAVGLHEIDSDRAMKLFNLFFQGKKNMAMRLATKCGHPSMPLYALAQILYALLKFDKFQPVMRMDEDKNCLDQSFSPVEGNRNGIIQQDLRAWAGADLAELITDKCQRAGISLVCGLRQMVKELDRKRISEIERAQKIQTQYQWVSADEQDTDD